MVSYEKNTEYLAHLNDILIGNSGYAIDIYFKPYEQQHRISSTLYIINLIKDSLISEGTSPQLDINPVFHIFFY